MAANTLRRATDELRPFPAVPRSHPDDHRQLAYAERWAAYDPRHGSYGCRDCLYGCRGHAYVCRDHSYGLGECSYVCREASYTVGGYPLVKKRHSGSMASFLGTKSMKTGP